jgi:oligopeptide transport system substrate-binding protein
MNQDTQTTQLKPAQRTGLFWWLANERGRRSKGRREGLSQLVGASALVLTLIGLLAGCTGGRSSSELEVEVAGGQKLTLSLAETLRINIVSEPPTLDWNKSTDTTSSWIQDNIMDGLIGYAATETQAELEPALATKWAGSKDSKVWAFTLREGVTWSDGVPLTAQHFFDGWRRLLAKETASEYAYQLFAIRNARAFNEGKAKWEDVGVRASGPNEITVELEKPVAYFPHIMTHHSTYPIRLDVIEKHGDKWTEPPNLVGLGPFVLRGWQHDKMIVLERNEKYWGEKAKLKHIAAYMIQEQATAINLFESGKLDAVHGLPAIELRRLREKPEYKRFATLTLMYYGFNVTKKPMDNVHLRRAVAHAIDRQEIVRILDGGEIPLSSFVPSGMFGYEPEIGLRFDVEKAKESLKKAGFPAGAMPKIELKINTNENHQRVAENVQAQLKRNLGLDVEIKNEEWKVYLSSLKADAPHIFRMGWLADYPDPDTFLKILTSFSDNNRTNWKNKRYDELVLKGATVSQPEERRKIYAEAQKLMLEDEVPVVPLYNSVAHILVSGRVEGYPTNVLARYVYDKTAIKK